MSKKWERYESLILRQMTSFGQRPIAGVLGVDESTVSRLKQGSITTLCQVLEIIGLKVVPADMQCYRPEDINPYIQLAKQHMSTLHSAEQLRWED